MKKLYQIVPPKGKEAFMQKLPYPKATRLEVILTQIGYIPRYVWLLSFFLVAVVLAAERHSAWEGEYGILWSMSAVMPVLALLVVTETFRSSGYGMVELEMAAKYNLPQVLLIRMGAMGMANLLLVLMGTPFVSQKTGMGWMRTAVYLLVPWLSTCVLSLEVEKYRKGRETLWNAIFCAGAVCVVGIYGITHQEFVYANEKFPVWMVAFAMLAILMARQIWSIWNKPEEWELTLG